MTKNTSIDERSGVLTARPKNSVSRDDWLLAIKDTLPPVTEDETALTAREFAELAGVAWTTGRLHLLQMVKDGQAVPVKKHILAGDGRRIRVSAFQLVKQKRSVKHARR